MKEITNLFWIVAILVLFLLGDNVSADSKKVINTKWSNIAIKGYDPVAYFRQGQPAKGKREYEMEWQGASWRFSSAEHMEQFRQNPEQYAPQYGGYCAWAVAMGYTASIDPSRWKIVDGKLYLNYNKRVQIKWEADIPGFIEKADKNWPGVLEK